jgi:uncharacterized protein (DUF1684 family)
VIGPALGAFFAAAISAALSAPADTHRAEWEAWRSDRMTRLRREDGWLTLIGLFWLQEGDNSVGSDPASVVRLPAEKVPAKMGKIRLDAGRLTADFDPGAGVTCDGKPVSAMALETDAGNAAPTVLRHGSISFYVIRRGDRLAVRAKDAESAARRSFQGTETFPYDERWRIEARFERYEPGRRIPMPNVLGAVEPADSPGALVFSWQGKSYRLDPVLEEGETDLFVVFGDATNGRETYGGGRFVYARPAVDGKTILDFNRSYNPPCVFTPYATCPLPPSQNRLPIRMEAGEKAWRGH